MGYCLKLREPLADGLKRIFCEEIDAAVGLCRHPAKQRGVTVHEVRKHLKKLRAALRLTKNEVGKNRSASEDRCLREIGRLVSDLRDDADQQFPRIEELLSMERESFSAAFAGWQKQAIPKLKSAGERLLKWPLAGITWKQICGVVAKTYRRGQVRLAKALKKRDPESFHVWRMSVKELWYQLRILRPLNRLVLEEIASGAKTLGELLGRGHDFAFLLARLDKERGDQALYDELVQLQKLIRKRGKRLRRDALELGRRFYAEPSKAFAKRISIFIDNRKS